MRRDVLIISDGPDTEPLRKLFAARGLRLSTQVLRHRLETRTSTPAVIIFHLASPEKATMVFESAHEIRERAEHSRFLLLAETGSEALAAQALREGFHDYISGWRVGDIIAAVERQLDFGFEAGPELPETMVGESDPIRDLRRRILRVGPTSSNVLITGETGTGKEVAAQMVHAASARRTRALVCLNCASIPDSLIESELFGYQRGAFTGAVQSYDGKMRAGDGGTVFFDEIGDMPLAAQAKLLRLLEQHVIEPLGSSRSVPLDIRVISATNCDLDRLSAENRFRRDLYFRLNVVRLHLPLLRERVEDIPLLVEHFRPLLNRQLNRCIKQIDEGAMSLLQEFEWPGNVRELKNVLESTFVECTGTTITADDLPAALQSSEATSRVSLECERLLRVLRETKWNKSKAAEKLRWSRMTLYRKMAKYHIECSDPKHTVTGCDS